MYEHISELENNEIRSYECNFCVGHLHKQSSSVRGGSEYGSGSKLEAYNRCFGSNGNTATEKKEDFAKFHQW
jgi:hypothetical protein